MEPYPSVCLFERQYLKIFGFKLLNEICHRRVKHQLTFS